MSRRWTEAEVSKLRHAMSDDAAPPVKVRKAYRSQLEAEYAGVLEMRKRAGEIVDYGYERITLWLEGRIRFSPDFDVLMPDGAVQMHEVKGWNHQVGRNKLRSAIVAFPGFQWFIAGTSKVPVRMLSPQDVPSISKVVR